MKWTKILSYNLVIAITLFLLIDFAYTRFILPPPHLRHGYEIIDHPVFHHTFRPQVDRTRETYRLCTDANGFKTHCANINRSSLAFDVVFIGDSFTEGISMSYEDTFVGMYDLAHPALKVANLGVTSYSPTRYLQKVSYYIDKGLQTKHVIVFIDSNDSRDEATLATYESFLYPKITLFIHKNFTFTKLITYLITHIAPIPCLFGYSVNDLECYWTDNVAIPNAQGYEAIGGVSQAMERSLSAMEELWSLLYQHGIKLSVGVYPWLSQLKQDGENNHHVKRWKDFCEQKCFAFINTFPAFFHLKEDLGLENTIEKYYLKNNPHFNKNGNKVIFEVLNNEFKAD